MSQPTTLREVAGLGQQPTALGDAALIVIDCQNTYRRGVMQLAGVGDALGEVERLLKRGRARQESRSSTSFTTPAPARPMTSARRSARFATGGAARGRAGDRQAPSQLVLGDGPRCPAPRKRHEESGSRRFHDSLLVNSTARGAFNLGYNATVIGDATATRDLPGVDGEVVRAAQLQTATLAGIRDLFAVVVPRVDDLPG